MPSQKQRRVSERSLANLKPYKPGQSGNPGGKPKGQTLMGAIREALNDKDRAKVVKAFVAAMQAGSLPHVKEYVEREEGKVPDRVAGPDGGAIPVKVLRDVSMDDI